MLHLSAAALLLYKFHVEEPDVNYDSHARLARLYCTEAMIGPG